MILKRCDFKKGEALFEKGKKSQNLFIYHSGKLLINGEYQEFKRGDFVGSYTEFEKDLVRTNEIVAMDDCLLFSLEKKGFDNYIRNNPGVYLRFFESID